MLIKTTNRNDHTILGMRGIANQQEEDEFWRRSNQYFKSQRDIPSGRSYLWNYYHAKSKDDLDNYRKNFDRIFPNSPGAGI